MKALWSGAISFGLVNVPVKLVSAVKERELSFDLLSKKDMSPVHYKRVSEATGREVAYQDIVKGYEYTKGKYVVVTPEDFSSASPKKSQSIDILEFVNDSEIDPVLYGKSYYLLPGKGGERTYHLLWKALRKSNTVGIAEFVFRTRSHVVALRPRADSSLMIHQLHYLGEIGVKPDGIPHNLTISSKELDLAVKLIGHLHGSFDAKTYKDTYTAKLKKVIAAKAKGKTVSVRESTSKPDAIVINLMEELKKSLESSKTKSDGHSTRVSRKKSA